MSKFIVEKDTFLNAFIKPLSVFDSQDNSCQLFKEDDSTLKGITYSSDRSVILESTLYNVDGDVMPSVVLRALPRFISAIGFCGEPKMSFEVKDNYLLHSSNNLKFKTFFLDSKFFDSKILLKLAKIKELECDSSFTITPSNVSDIKRSKTFARATDKVYISSDGSGVVATRDDKEKSSIDTMSFQIASDFSGEILKDIPIHISFFDLLLEKTDSILVSVNAEYGVFQFLIKNDKCKLHYITSALREKNK